MSNNTFKFDDDTRSLKCCDWQMTFVSNKLEENDERWNKNLQFVNVIFNLETTVNNDT